MPMFTNIWQLHSKPCPILMQPPDAREIVWFPEPLKIMRKHGVLSQGFWRLQTSWKSIFQSCCTKNEDLVWPQKPRVGPRGSINRKRTPPEGKQHAALGLWGKLHSSTRLTRLEEWHKAAFFGDSSGATAEIEDLYFTTSLGTASW